MKNLSYKQRGFIFIIIAIIAMFVVNKVSDRNSEIDLQDTKTSIDNVSKGTKGGAYIAAKQHIRNQLKAPSTAKFESITSCKITDLNDGRYYVHIKVDAQNSYGAMIRKTFSVEIECTGKDLWKCNEIQEY